jgi:transcriptional regulator with XRE-family HTH domain
VDVHVIDRANLGQRIKQARLNADFSQKELASALGLDSHATVTAMEQGRIAITTDRLNDIARVLHCSIASLLGEHIMPQDVEVTLRLPRRAWEWWAESNPDPVADMTAWLSDIATTARNL